LDAKKQKKTKDLKVHFYSSNRTQIACPARFVQVIVIIGIGVAFSKIRAFVRSGPSGNRDKPNNCFTAFIKITLARTDFKLTSNAFFNSRTVLNSTPNQEANKASVKSKDEDSEDIYQEVNEPQMDNPLYESTDGEPIVSGNILYDR
jgi:hypothetical protein